MDWPDKILIVVLLLIAHTLGTWLELSDAQRTYHLFIVLVLAWPPKESE